MRMYEESIMEDMCPCVRLNMIEVSCFFLRKQLIQESERLVMNIAVEFKE